SLRPAVGTDRLEFGHASRPPSKEREAEHSSHSRGRAASSTKAQAGSTKVTVCVRERARRQEYNTAFPRLQLFCFLSRSPISSACCSVCVIHAVGPLMRQPLSSHPCQPIVAKHELKHDG